jgi:hypothetical protein
MSNPFLGYNTMHSPSAVTDHYGDDEGGWYSGTPWHLAGLMLAAVIVITAMHMAGFRAMVGVGRG